jgi:hypothetical protein
MKTRIAFRSIALLAFSLFLSIRLAAEQPNFNFGELKNFSTVCQKAGVIWAVHYGEDKEGHVVYTVFNKGNGPSPVSPTYTVRSDGSRQTALNIQIDGKKVSPPDPAKNSMVIVDGKVERGKFKPLILEEFQRYLKDESPLSIDSIEDFGKESSENLDRASK